MTNNLVKSFTLTKIIKRERSGNKNIY